MWDPQPPSKHASPLSPQPPSNLHRPHVITDTPAKRITFYKSGDSQFGGVRMAVHKRSFKCFDALLDDLSQKVPLPFGVRTVTTPQGTHTIKHLEQLQDGGCYLCSDRRQAKPINMELARKHPGVWYNDNRRPHRPETSSSTHTGHMPYKKRRILLVKNSEPGIRRSIVLSRRSTRSLRSFLEEVSEVMQFHVRKLYTAEGRRIESVQSLMTCSGVLVCVGREAFSPMLVNFIRKSSEERLPGLNSRSPGLGPRTPGNGARSPGTQGVRSPPHGAQSRASEYSEVYESRKNVNFGLETKKSIIHPRSDSSNRSARFSLSSEKSYGNGVSAYSQAKPAIMNEDIEKRVLVNKDGSLSVEMRVRFRLRNDETLQWSTQIKKSPSLTNECCPLSQAQPHYLQQGQSESCSDPDSTAYDHEGVHCSRQTLQHAPHGNTCPCCCQRAEQQYDFWENPAHSCKPPPVPPPHAHSHTHTMMRHTHSSSSSSSCNSRRVVRCRARLSGTEQKQLMQEETCVTEQVERRVEVEQDGETHVEVCKVSRCSSRSEVVATDSNLQLHSRKSVEDDSLMEVEGERPLSTVSSSSHVLQLLKEDQDEEGIENGSRGVSAASSCHCGEATVDSKNEEEEMDQAPSVKHSRASCRSSKTKGQNSEDNGSADDEDEEIKRVVSSLSGRTGGSLHSRASSVCPHCGGCKRGADSVTPKPATPLSSQETANNNSENEGSDVSVVSTQSNKTNLTNNGRISADRASGCMSKMSNPEAAGNEEQERAGSTASARSHRSCKSHKSSCKGSTGVPADNDGDKSPSAMSARSGKSHKSSCKAESPDIRTREEAEGENAVERAQSALSAKSGASSKTCASVKLSVKAASPTEDSAPEEDNTSNRSHSALSVKSNTDKVDQTGSALSAKSTKSHLSAKSGTSHRSKCSHCARAVSPGDNPGIQVTGEDEGMEAEERAGSAISALSNLTAKSNKSHKSKASKRSISPRSEAGGDAEKRSVSQMSGVSVKSNLSVKSSKHNDNTDEVVAPAEEEEKEMEEEETEQRPASARSAKLEIDKRSASAMSSKSHKSNCEGSEKGDDAGDGEKDEDRAASALSSKSASGKSHISAKSSKSQKSHKSTAAPNPDEDGDKSQERVASALSVKSKSSARTSTSHKSSCSKNLKLESPIQNVITIQTPGGADEEGNETTERPLSAASAKSGKSNLSSALMHKSDIAVIETADEEKVATPSPKPPSSPKSTVQQLLPGPDVGETRGQSALSVHSKTSTKSGRSKCRCGAASAHDKANKEKDDEEMKSEGASEAAGSIRSSSTRRRGRESEGTGRPLSQNSGSVSLGLPEDQETADSDSGKSTVSFHITTERRSRRKTATPNGAKSSEQLAVKENLLETGSIKSRKSSASSSKSHLSHKNPAGDIPTIEAPEGIDDQGETGSVRSVSTTKASNADAQSHRASTAMSSASAKVRNKSPSSATAKRKAADSGKSETEDPVDSRPASKTEGIQDITEKTASVHSKSLCCLRPESAASAHSGSKMKASKESKGEGSVKLDSLDPLKSPKARSSGSSKRKTMTKEAPIISSSPCPVHSSRPCSKEEAYSESTLSHSLSAADLLKETIAAARPHSRQSKTSDKPRSERSGKCHRSRNQRHQEETQELTPACLPNASPNEVVSEWLRSIPTDNTMLTLGDELNEDRDLETAVDEEPKEEIPKEQESPEDEKVDQEESVEAKEEDKEKEEEDECDAAEEKGLEQPAGDAVVGSSQPNHQESSGESRNWNSSAAVMKVLLSSSLGRCRSMPEVSPVYGRRLSTSARGLLDCLAQLQLIEPAVCPERQKHHNQQYEDIMAILQSLWLAEPENIPGKDSNGDQISPPRSSSGVGMSSGSAGSGKENGNQGEDETNNTKTKGTESLHEEEEVDKVAEAENVEKEEVEAEPEELKIDVDIAEEAVDAEEQNTDLPSEDNPKAVETPSSSDKSSANSSSKSRTDNETQEDSSTGTPPTVLRAPLSKRPSQDPDPVWILHLLKKLEKQFMNHYITAMAEFKVRWDLDDSLILDTMISELKEEVSRRIQNSIEREMSKIQSRAGKGGRSPRPPLGGNLSRESTMTEKRRRMLKVMKNKSVKTADSLSDGENTADFSDQRSDDEYCPCDACVRKKMAARPLRMNPNAAEAPVMMEFDLLKILQLKKGPSPAPVDVPQAEVVQEEEEEEENNLEVVEEEEEEEGDESKEDIKADVVLEETIPEEDEEIAEDEEEEGVEAVEEEEAENEENSGEQEEGEEETSDNGDVEEEEEGECQCQCAVHVEEGEGEEAAAETEDAEETCDNTGEDEAADGDEKTEDEEGETGTGEEEEESDKETAKGEATGEGETTEGEVSDSKPEDEEGETTGRESGEEGPSGETGDDSDVKEASNEESKQEEEENGSASAEAGDEEDGDDCTGEDDKGGESGEQEVEASEEELTSPQGQGVTEGEEADAEDSEDTDAKRPSDTSVDESGQEGGGATGEEEEKEGGDDVEEFKPEEDEEEVNRNKKEDGALLQQFTRTSVESQPGSLEDIDTDSPRIPVQSIEVPKMAPEVSAGGGSGNRRSRSPARVKRRKPKLSDVEMDDF
ncbi:retinitis pigmentosa 1-like 1 protein [Notolabrus celidotus]|uniref:retinitis pigmentosa 1-like 1 protein n=1 Tax=Notolabrus celidotus TaxID=1203425 RepID=UPI00149031FE|nr:retinitis pigmentosa 1-like 1 protein [Notolabrus celidotus]XP_034533671.1 retinitis pigmentosa 1-like 1 protein [Notolabrus celidotus]